MAHHRGYRALTLLYPKTFRELYRDDLLQAYDDLVSTVGPARARGRTTLDLLITVPRYRLETTMNNHRSDTRLHILVGALIVVGAAVTLDVGIAFAAIPLGIAAILAIAYRSNLARSLRTPHLDARRRRLVTSAWLAALTVLIIPVFYVHVGRHDDWGSSLVLVAYNAAFMIAAASSVVYLIAGLATKKSPIGGAPSAPAIST